MHRLRACYLKLQYVFASRDGRRQSVRDKEILRLCVFSCVCVLVTCVRWLWQEAATAFRWIKEQQESWADDVDRNATGRTWDGRHGDALWIGSFQSAWGIHCFPTVWIAEFPRVHLSSFQSSFAWLKSQVEHLSIKQFSQISAFILATGTRLYNSSSDALISTFSHPKPNSFILCFNKCWLLKMGMKVPSAKTVSFATHTCLVGCTGRTEEHALTMTWFLKRDQPDSQTLQQFIGFYLFLVHVTTVTHQVLFYSMVMKKWTQISNKKASWHKFTPLAILNLKKEIFSGSGSSGTWSLQ